MLICLSLLGRLDLLGKRFTEGILIQQAVHKEVVESGKGRPGHLERLEEDGKFRLSAAVRMEALRAVGEVA